MKKNYFRRKFLALILLLEIFHTIELSEAKKVDCVRFLHFNWGRPVGTVETCFMDKSTTIDEPGVTIATLGETVGGLSLSSSKKIIYLPDNVNGSFLNLENYDASGCAVKDITKRNFNGLYKLKVLYLSGNQIEKIATDTFEGLVLLEKLWLALNNIKFMNGEAFQGLNKLNDVWLSGNFCIDKTFEGSTQIAAMPRVVNETCRFEEEEVTEIAETATTDAV